MIAQWYRDHNQMPIPYTSLPKTGIIVDEIVAGFLYKTDSNVAIIENFISDPSSNKDHRRESIDVCMSTLVKEAKSQGFSYILSYPTHKRMEKDHSRWGFVRSHETCAICVKEL